MEDKLKQYLIPILNDYRVYPDDVTEIRLKFYNADCIGVNFVISTIDKDGMLLNIHLLSFYADYIENYKDEYPDELLGIYNYFVDKVNHILGIDITKHIYFEYPENIDKSADNCVYINYYPKHNKLNLYTYRETRYTDTYSYVINQVS